MSVPESFRIVGFIILWELSKRTFKWLYHGWLYLTGQYITIHESGYRIRIKTDNISDLYKIRERVRKAIADEN